MLDHSEFQDVVKSLMDDDVLGRAAALKVLTASPSGDPRVFPYIARLLEDRSACVISIPYRFGEIRWLAAHALAAERAAMCVREPVDLLGVVQPLTTDELEEAERKAGIRGQGGLDGVLETFSRLNAIGQLPVCDLHLD